jgi:hypothetical protein
MDTKELINIIKKSFESNIYIFQDYVSGREEFFKEIEDEITKLQNEEDKAFGIIRGEDAEKFLRKMKEIDSKIDSKIQKSKIEKKCYADEMKWNHNMCAMQSSCDKCEAYK